VAGRRKKLDDGYLRETFTCLAQGADQARDFLTRYPKAAYIERGRKLARTTRWRPSNSRCDGCAAPLAIRSSLASPEGGGWTRADTWRRLLLFSPSNLWLDRLMNEAGHRPGRAPFRKSNADRRARARLPADAARYASPGTFEDEVMQLVSLTIATMFRLDPCQIPEQEDMPFKLHLFDIALSLQPAARIQGSGLPSGAQCAASVSAAGNARTQAFRQPTLRNSTEIGGSELSVLTQRNPQLQNCTTR